MVSKVCDEIDAKVRKSLKDVGYSVSTLTKLSGGSVNWIYHATLSEPLEDGFLEILVKHGERFMASKPEFPLTLIRCGIEVDFLRSLSHDPVTGTTSPRDSFSFTVRTPKFFHFDEQPEQTNQIFEYLPNGINLKDYALQHYPAPTPQALQPQSMQLGKALGRWLKGFNEWSSQQPQLRVVASKNTEAEVIKHMINFTWFFDRIKEFPILLEGIAYDVKGAFEEVEKMAAEERKDQSKLQILHGDFWTGNVLLPNSPIQEGKDVPLFVIDWECAYLGVPSVDLGQMMGEMYALWLYKSIAAGLWMIEGLLEAYGPVSERFAFRTAIQMGAHLLCTTTTFPGWGTPKKIEEVAMIGRDLIVRAWKRDRSWFESGELACLFEQVA